METLVDKNADVGEIDNGYQESSGAGLHQMSDLLPAQTLSDDFTY